MKSLISSLTVGALIVAVAMPVAGAAVAAPDPARGKQQFDYWCGTCHAPDPREDGRLLPGTQSLQVKYKGSKPAALEQRTDLVPVLVTQVIRHGSEGMPFFRITEISNSQADDIAAYLSRNTK